MVAISEVRPTARMLITINSPACTPRILVSAARVPWRRPLAMSSVRSDREEARARCRQRRKRDRLAGTWGALMGRRDWCIMHDRTNGVSGPQSFLHGDALEA